MHSAAPAELTESAPAAPAPPPAHITMPRTMMRFYSHFTARLAQPPQSPVTGDADNTLAALSAAQREALGPVLWQWLALVAASAQPPPRPSPHTAAPAPLSPPAVERLLQLGCTALFVPSGGEAAGHAAPRLCPPDPPAPWGRDERWRRRDPAADLLAASLQELSQHGPLFSAWCALAYMCLRPASLSWKGTEPDAECGGADAAADAVAAVQRLRVAWKASLARVRGAAALHASVDAGAGIDADAAAQLWAAMCETRSARAVDAEDDVRGPSDGDTAVDMHLWSAQWYGECCRVAAKGRDDGFREERAGLPAALLTRVMQYMCGRLEAELQHQARRRRRRSEAELADAEGPSSSTTTANAESPSATANAVGTVTATTAATTTVSATSAVVPMLRVEQRQRPLRIGSLAALALQPAMNTAAAAAAAAAAGPTSRAPGRRRRRGWGLRPDDSDDSDEEEDADSDGSGTTARSSGSGVARLLRAGPHQRFEVGIASGVLTTFDMTLLDGPGGGGLLAGSSGARAAADAACMPRLTGESHLRAGTVHWWTLSNQQQQMQSTRRAAPAAAATAATGGKRRL